MGDTSLDRYACACSAIYRNREGLDTHLAEIQIQKTYHTTQLEKCFAHSRSDNDEHFCDGSCMNLCLTCPHNACKLKSTAYKTNAKLVRHFAIHVTCDEVCVFCCIRFQETQKFLRHAEDCHKKEKGRKAHFMSSTCTELVLNVTHELHVARHRKPSSDTNFEGKRRRVVSDVDSGTLDTERAGKICVINEGRQIAQAATQLSYPGQPTLTFMEMPAGEESNSADMNGAVSADMNELVSADMNGLVDRVDMNGRVAVDSVDMNPFGEVSPGFYPNQEEGLESFNYAPILQIISSPATFWER